MENLCKAEMLIERMKHINGRMEVYSVIVYGYESGMDDKGVIRHCGFYLSKDGRRITQKPNVSILHRDKFFDANGIEIPEPTLTLPCNVIYGPST